ncbi:MAG TPA: gliding motility lipoprotein GldH [Flavipsychrobacter sp.]|nr:gliding motility lipoprotein GldH [Flavipsychrobacter sp.]
MQFSSFRIFITLATVLVFTGCMKSPYFQKDVAIPNYQWKYDYQPVFKIDIQDTAALYNLYFMIRHTEAYPYSNIWMWIYTKEPNDTTFKRSRIEIPLAEKSGKWLGRGMGEIWEQRMPITRNDAPMIFDKKGTYEIKFEQNMRVNPLPEILQVGLRVEKLGYKK